MERVLSNVSIGSRSSGFTPFTIFGYAFHPLNATTQAPSIYTPQMAARDNRKIKRNAYVIFNGAQQNAIIFANRRFYSAVDRFQRAKQLHDILLLGSLLTASNWAISSRQWEDNDFPVTPTNHLRQVSRDENQIVSDITNIYTMLNDPNWCSRYQNGFHLRMLLNASNLFVTEARFLSCMVIWELLYSRIFQESDNLHKIIMGLLNHFYPGRVNSTVFTSGRVGGISKNIFYVLRNQLAHNGLLPINRSYSEQWMKSLPNSGSYGSLAWGVFDYLQFFEELTQVLVFKTLNLDIASRLDIWNFNTNLNAFLSTGRVR